MRPLRDENDLRALLSAALDLIEPVASGYRLVGTGAALLQGVALPTGDIDILYADRDGVDAFAAGLANCEVVQAPVWLAEARQYYAAFAIDGVAVSASTLEWDDDSAAARVAAGPWHHYVEVPCERHLVRAGRLELQLVADVVRDRPDRLVPLLAHLRRHGADPALVERGMRAWKVPAGRRAEILAGL